MSYKAHKLIAAMAATSIALTPIAAQANTRAGDSATLYTGAASQPGVGRAGAGESLDGSSDILAALLVALWATGIIVIVADIEFGDGNDNQSPGAN